MKKEVLKVLWGSLPKAAKALGITKGAIYQWEEHLPLDKIDRVRGAAMRTGVYKPSLFPEQAKE